jgi:CubicO group peptidase (beta-lactamase class C family)
MPTSLNTKIQTLLNQRIDAGVEVGLQVAVYHRGEMVADAWAGVADATSGRPVDGETLFTSWSTTKGFVATCLHLLAERGQLDYDTPIATYWPEFAQNGKESATVRHALTHTVGLPQMPDDPTPAMMCDWQAMCDFLAAQAPLWTPGSRTGYHAWTFGWLVGEIVHRVDGRPLAQFAQEELCQPLGIRDFYLGIPDEVEARVATLQHAPPVADVPAPGELLLRCLPPAVTNAQTVNRPDIRRASIPGGGGIMNARAIARHYAMLAGGGSLDGVRLLSPERIDQMRSLQTDDHDIVRDRQIRRGMGYVLGGLETAGGNQAMGNAGNEFGHPGLGGSIGFADPARQLSLGLTKTLLTAHPDPTESTAFLVAEATRKHLDGKLV